MKYQNIKIVGQVLNREHVDVYLLEVCVFDHAELSERKSVTVTVTVKVLDIDDEAPVWHFPKNSDNWVNITATQSVGKEVTRVEAKDADTSSNLTYTLLRNSAYFGVELLTGKVIVNRELRPGQYKLHLKVDDNAIPKSHSKEACLYINVYGIHSAQNVRDVRINLTIIIAMIVITAIISVVLVTAIVCVRKRAFRPTTASYMVSEFEKTDSPYQCHCPDDGCSVQQSATLQREPVYHQLCTSPRLDRFCPMSTFSAATIDRPYQDSVASLHEFSHKQPQSQLSVEIQNNEVSLTAFVVWKWHLVTYIDLWVFGMLLFQSHNLNQI